MSLECQRLGAPELGEAFVAECRRLSGDDPPERLMHFCAVLRSLVRAKLAVWRMREAGADTVRWTARAADLVCEDHFRDLIASLSAAPEPCPRSAQPL